MFYFDKSSVKLKDKHLSECGFTLVELIMVIVLLGVLAVFAAPRFFNSNEFNAYGFKDETLTLLRYAQKTAVAQRRTVCVDFISEPASATLSIASLAGSRTCDLSLIGPNKNCFDALSGLSGCVNARPGVSYSSVGPANINFDGLGRPIGAASTLTIQVALYGMPISQVVFVEPETGYVHE